MNRQIFFLIDCNNFFASCERVFNPSLAKKGVAVLSNNDGCVIARSDEVKKLGIPMGAPFHEYRKIMERNKIEVLSANFQLYGDLSRRIMNTLQTFAEELEVYSIDEAFMIFDIKSEKFDHRYHINLAKKIISVVNKQIGIPISVGIGRTKTEAKLAAYIAKKMRDKSKGVFNFLEYQDNKRDEFLRRIPAGEIWGIGWRFSEFLKKNGMFTALDFKKADTTWVKKNMSVVGQRTQLELNGIPCVAKHSITETKKSIICSRSFGKSVTALSDLSESVSYFATKAAAKLRRNKGLASIVGVTVMSNKHNENEERYYNSTSIILPEASSYTPDIIHAANDALKKIFKNGVKYKKTLVYLGGIIPSENYQLSLYHEEKNLPKKIAVSSTLDSINKKYMKEAITFASSGLKREWKMRQNSKSPEYTTKWGEIPVVS